jgi:hypothetical protein
MRRPILAGTAILAIAISIGSSANACGCAHSDGATNALGGNAPTTSIRPRPRPAYFYLDTGGLRRHNRSTGWGQYPDPLFNPGYAGYGGSSTDTSSWGYSHDNFAAEAEPSDAAERAGAEARVMAGLDALMPSAEFLACAQVGFPGVEAPAALLQAWFIRTQQEC